jgi:sulfide dehydrogenase cytochrome subunit
MRIGTAKFLALVGLSFGVATGVCADPGRNLAAACSACHGTNGRSVGGMPALAGKEKALIVAQMREFRDGKRPATIMHQIAKGYTDEQFEILAAYFSSQKLVASQR